MKDLIKDAGQLTKVIGLSTAIGMMHCPAFAQGEASQGDAEVVQPAAKIDIADTDESNDSNVFELGTVTVYGNRKSSAEQAESYIGRKKIDLFEKKDVATALSRLPGVLYNRPAGGRHESSLYIRGFDSTEVPVFIDGIPVYIPYDGNVDLGRFMTGDVSSIQLAKGYSSVMYGPNTLGGAINIVTMRPKKKLDGLITIGTATGRTTETSVNLGTLQDKWYAQLSGSVYERRYTRTAEKFRGIDAQREEVNTDRNNYWTRDRKIGLKLGFIPNATDEYVFSYSKQEAKKSPGNADYGFTETTWDWPRWDRETISFFSNTRFLNNKFYLKPRIFYDTFQNTLYGWVGNDYSSHYDDRAYGGAIELGTDILENHLIKAQFNYKYDHHGEYATAGRGSVKIADMGKTVEQELMSFALEDTYKITPHWEAQAGVIYSRRKTTDTGIGAKLEGLLEKYPKARSLLNPTMDATDPQLAIFYKPSDQNTFHYSVAKKTRFPHIKQQFSNYGSGQTVCPPGKNCKKNPNLQVPLFTLQNPGLKPERAIHHELGYRGTPLEGLFVQASVYLNRTRDKIDHTDRDFDAFPGYAIQQTINLRGITERKGFDLEVEYDANTYLTMGLTYSYMHIRKKDDTSYHFTNMPENSGTLWAEIHPLEWLKVIPSVELRESSWYDTKGKYRNPGYGLVDLKVSITPPMMKYVTFNIGAENIFNKDYRRYNDTYPSPGRNLYANMRADF